MSDIQFICLYFNHTYSLPTKFLDSVPVIWASCFGAQIVFVQCFSVVYRGLVIYYTLWPHILLKLLFQQNILFYTSYCLWIISFVQFVLGFADTYLHYQITLLIHILQHLNVPSSNFYRFLGLPLHIPFFCIVVHFIGSYFESVVPLHKQKFQHDRKKWTSQEKIWQIYQQTIIREKSRNEKLFSFTWGHHMFYRGQHSFTKKVWIIANATHAFKAWKLATKYLKWIKSPNPCRNLTTSYKLQQRKYAYTSAVIILEEHSYCIASRTSKWKLQYDIIFNHTDYHSASAHQEFQMRPHLTC